MNLQEYAEKHGIASQDGEYPFFKFFRKENNELASILEKARYVPGQTYKEPEIDLDKKNVYGKGINVSTLKFIVGFVEENWGGKPLNFENTVLHYAFVPTDLSEKEYCIPNIEEIDEEIDEEKMIRVPKERGKIRVAKARISKEELSWRIAFPHIKTPEAAYLFGRGFQENLTEEELKVLANLVYQDPKNSYFAGRDWGDDRFNPFAQILANSVSQNPEYSSYAGCEWSDDRKKFLKKTA